MTGARCPCPSLRWERCERTSAKTDSRPGSDFQSCRHRAWLPARNALPCERSARRESNAATCPSGRCWAGGNGPVQPSRRCLATCRADTWSIVPKRSPQWPHAPPYSTACGCAPSDRFAATTHSGFLAPVARHRWSSDPPRSKREQDGSPRPTSSFSNRSRSAMCCAKSVFFAGSAAFSGCCKCRVAALREDRFARLRRVERGERGQPEDQEDFECAFHVGDGS